MVDTSPASGPGGPPSGPDAVRPTAGGATRTAAAGAAASGPGEPNAAASGPGEPNAAASGPGEPNAAGPGELGAAAGSVPLPPELAAAATALFGARLPVAVGYAELLATDGVLRGLIGPRETPRIWDRHLLNCAALVELIPAGRLVIDVGSGAGLPGVVLAIARPDLEIVLVEPLARRTVFLTDVIDRLGLGAAVTVVRARAEEYPATGGRPGDIVTARAVAPLDRLVGWCLPLVGLGGRLLAMKGASAADEAALHQAAVQRLGGGQPVVRRCGVGLLEPPTTVVDIVRERAVGKGRSKAARSGRGGRSRRAG